MRFPTGLSLPILVAVVIAIPASLLLGSALAQSNDTLAAEFPESHQNSPFHTGPSSVSRLVVTFNRPVADFGQETSSVQVTGGRVSDVLTFSVQSENRGTEKLYIFVLNATAEGPMTFRLIPNRTCSSGGICTENGDLLTRVPEARVIPGVGAISFEEASYTATELAAAEVAVSLKPEPGRNVTIPISVTYGSGIGVEDVAGIPDSLNFIAGETQKSFTVTPVENGFEGDRGSISIAFGEFPAGVAAGGHTSTDLTIHYGEILSATMSVGSNGGFLGFSTFSEDEAGGLTNREFTWRGTTHTVTNIVLESGDFSESSDVSFEVSPGLTQDEDCLFLVLGESTFSLASGQVNNRQFFWYGTELDWEINDTVEVELRQFPPSFRSRSSDGRDNNIRHRTWGTVGSDLLRMATVSYMDRVAQPPTWLPDARAISNAAQDQDRSMPNSDMASDILWQWGQFLDHDISLTPPGFPAEQLNIPVPSGDSTFDPSGNGQRALSFSRSEYDSDTGMGADNPREQVNTITAFIDASQVYGSDVQRARALRTNDGTGKLRTSANGRFLMYNTMGLENDGGNQRTDLFLAGDVRANEQAGLTAMHTLFLREHNRLADEIAETHPG